MSPIPDHPMRYALTNELHARPIPQVEVPGHAVLLAVKPAENAVARDRDVDRAHLTDLLDRFGSTHPSPGAIHHATDLGRNRLKWESHTEFVTYTAIIPGRPERAFDPALFEVFPEDWLAQAPGMRITSILLRIDYIPEDVATIGPMLADWFVEESVACTSVLDGMGIVASDFRIDPAGHIRMAFFVRQGTGARRVGRIVQRLCEIEIYKSMSLLGLARARRLSPEMGALDQELSRLATTMNQDGQRPEATLEKLLDISAQLETLELHSSFRFGATGAYEALVQSRIAVLREERFEGRQTLSEFMMRRYDPAMRTVKSAEARLHALSDRAMRAGNLLGTRVDVDRSRQNQKLLESMDKRAAMQLHLQRTVEGLSTVAISYYAVNLAANIGLPLAEPLGLGRAALLAMLTPPVMLAVWLLIRRIRARIT